MVQRLSDQWAVMCDGVLGLFSYKDMCREVCYSLHNAQNNEINAHSVQNNVSSFNCSCVCTSGTDALMGLYITDLCVCAFPRTSE